MKGALISRGDCFFCLTPGVAELRQDKHGRPYMRCTDCLTRAFLYNNRALQGPRDLWGLAVTYNQLCPADPVPDTIRVRQA